MKQQQFFKPSPQEHGGALSKGKRKSKRPLSTKKPIHLTLRSDQTKGSRSLLRHQTMIRSVIQKGTARFNVKVYQLAICGNHLHFLVRGKSHLDLQNFFRVVAGHIAQNILRSVPYTKQEAAVFENEVDSVRRGSTNGMPATSKRGNAV